jgi:hypothetical protein
MTTAHAIDWPQVLADRLTTTSPDVLRELLATFIHTLMGGEPTRCAGPVTTDAAVNGIELFADEPEAAERVTLL